MNSSSGTGSGSVSLVTGSPSGGSCSSGGGLSGRFSVPCVGCSLMSLISSSLPLPIGSLVSNVAVHERAVQAEPALAAALVVADLGQEGVPLLRVAPGAGHVGRLVVAVMSGVDVERVRRAADRTVVGGGSETGVDVHAAELGSERLQELAAQVLQAV